MAIDKTTDKPLPTYDPSPDDKKLISEMEEDFSRGKRNRLPYEGQWYVNASFIRGQQRVLWDVNLQTLITPPAPSHRVRRSFNLLFPKVRARQAKFLKNRPKPEVKPATNDIKDIPNARMTTKALEFGRRKWGLEDKYQHVVQWAMQAGHGYWWIGWNPAILGKVRIQNETTGQSTIQQGQLGDAEIEVSSPFELLIADNSIATLGLQPWIMRLKTRPVEWIKSRFEAGQYVAAEGKNDVAFRYEKAIATLSPIASGIMTTDLGNDKSQSPTAIVKEKFIRPTAEFPKGRYLVVANGVLLKQQDELPYQMWDMNNPYPVVDFPDVAPAGQYWITTVVEQCIPIQRQYNILRSKLEENLKLMVHPKILVAKQHNLAPGVWGSEGGEIVEYQAHPGIPAPQIVPPANIASDAWRTFDLLNKELDNIFHIYPEAEGRVGQATSGFQTNLLQEATDAVHAPDIRQHEMALEEAALKIRRVMKLLYTVPRLVSITSNDDQVEAFEFSAEDIDDNADIIIQSGSALPDLKGAKIQMALELRNSRIFGNPDDPEVNRKVLSMLDIGDLSSIYADARRDEERARLENVDFESHKPVDPPLFCDNHDIHSKIHTDQLKSSTFKDWPQQVQMSMIDHILWHAVFINPQAAAQIAAIYSRPVPQLPTVQPPAPALPPGQPGPPQAGPQGPGGAGPAALPPGGGPQGPPPMDAAANAGANGNVQAIPQGVAAPMGNNATMPM